MTLYDLSQTYLDWCLGNRKKITYDKHLLYEKSFIGQVGIRLHWLRNIIPLENGFPSHDKATGKKMLHSVMAWSIEKRPCLQLELSSEFLERFPEWQQQHLSKCLPGLGNLTTD